MRREVLGLSQADLAERLGCTRGFVSMLETGHAVPGRALANRIARVTDGAVRAEDWDVAEHAPSYASEEPTSPEAA